MFQTIKQSFITIIICLILLAGVNYVMAWTAPTASPPADNVPAPINVSSDSQYKEGALGVGGVFHGYSSAIFDRKITMISQTEDTDSDDTLVTKGYIDGKVGTDPALILGENYPSSKFCECPEQYHGTLTPGSTVAPAGRLAIEYFGSMYDGTYNVVRYCRYYYYGNNEWSARECWSGVN